MGPEFFQTHMGRQFFESTMPRIAKALEKIVTAFEPQIMELSAAKKIEHQEFWKAAFLAALHSMNPDAMDPVKAAMGRADEALLIMIGRWETPPADRG